MMTVTGVRQSEWCVSADVVTDKEVPVSHNWVANDVLNYCKTALAAVKIHQKDQQENDLIF